MDIPDNCISQREHREIINILIALVIKLINSNVAALGIACLSALPVDFIDCNLQLLSCIPYPC